MTPPAPTTHESDEDFEAEVRAMLARRATDVSPTPSPSPGDTTLSAIAPRASRHGDFPVRRSLAGAAAAAVLVAGVATYAVSRDPSPSVETSTGSEATSDPIIWPLGDGSRVDNPESAARVYFAEVVGRGGLETPLATWSPAAIEGDTGSIM